MTENFNFKLYLNMKTKSTKSHVYNIECLPTLKKTQSQPCQPSFATCKFYTCFINKSSQSWSFQPYIPKLAPLSEVSKTRFVTFHL